MTTRQSQNGQEGRKARYRVRAIDLMVGHTLPYAIYDDHGRLLMARGATLANQHQRRKLLALGFTDTKPPKLNLTKSNSRSDRRRQQQEALDIRLEGLLFSAGRLKPEDAREAGAALGPLAHRIAELATESLDTALALAHLPLDWPHPLAAGFRAALLTAATLQGSDEPSETLNQTVAACLALPLTPSPGPTPRDGLPEHLATLTRVTGRYLSRVCPPPDQPPSAPIDALRALRGSTGGPGMAEAVERLLALLTPFPPGSYVSVRDRGIGVVVQLTASPAEPIALLFADGAGRRLRKPRLLAVDKSICPIDRALARDRVTVALDPREIYPHTYHLDD